MNFISLIGTGLLQKAYKNIPPNGKMLTVFPLGLKQGDGSFYCHFFSVVATDSTVSQGKKHSSC